MLMLLCFLGFPRFGPEIAVMAFGSQVLKGELRISNMGHDLSHLQVGSY